MDIVARAGRTLSIFKVFLMGGERKRGLPLESPLSRDNSSLYLNESKENPNVRCNDNYDYYALRDIKRDEELTLITRPLAAIPGNNSWVNERGEFLAYAPVSTGGDGPPSTGFHTPAPITGRPADP